MRREKGERGFKQCPDGRGRTRAEQGRIPFEQDGGMQASNPPAARPRSTPGSADEISSSAGGEGDDDVVDKILKEWMGVKEGGKGALEREKVQPNRCAKL